MEALRDAGRWAGELVAERTDGSLLDIHLSASIVTDEAGKPTCVMASGIDITERKRVEEALKTRARILENMVEGVNVSDKNGIIFFTNPAFDAMFGYERGELIGKHVSILNRDSALFS